MDLEWPSWPQNCKDVQSRTDPNPSVMNITHHTLPQPRINLLIWVTTIFSTVLKHTIILCEICLKLHKTQYKLCSHYTPHDLSSNATLMTNMSYMAILTNTFMLWLNEHFDLHGLLVFDMGICRVRQKGKKV